jgi:hypothetical protein
MITPLFLMPPKYPVSCKLQYCINDDPTYTVVVQGIDILIAMKYYSTMLQFTSCYFQQLLYVQ